MISAHYNEYGYWIESNGLEIYRAGNHPLDSVAYTSEGGLSLPTIRAYAQQTAREIAAERNEPYVGIEHVAEE